MGTKDTKSTTMKKGQDEEAKRLSTMSREQREQMQDKRKQLGPLETLKKAQLKEKMTKKGNAMGRVRGQQHEPTLGTSWNNLEAVLLVHTQMNPRTVKTPLKYVCEPKCLFSFHMLINVNGKYQFVTCKDTNRLKTQGPQNIITGIAI